ncbi:MAG: 4Fe-4S binding protein, partial [Lachnospiraceae bacterium]|nr:4Fe-4S binding protein [Lachnospiraceae bacterium]
ECGLDNVSQIIGRSLQYVSETTDTIERDTVTFPIVNREKCNGCGRCELSCMDGGHQAITLNENRKPVVDGKKCVGCHLCLLVCPINAIRASEKRIHL